MGAKGIQTRRRLLEATEALLNTTPLRDLRVAQIVRLANTSAATFYVYFNDVAEAVLALIGETTQSPPAIMDLLAKPWRGDASLDRAHEFVAAYVELWQAHAPVFRVRNLASDEGDARFAQLRVNAVQPLMLKMNARIAERQAAGGIPAHLDTYSTTGALLAMIERVAAAPAASPGTGVTRPRLLHVAAYFAALAMGEVAPPPPRAAGRAGDGRLAPIIPRLQPAQEAAAQINLHGQAIGAKGARTRQCLVDATNELLRSTPLLGLSVAQIAKRARTSTSTFYLYFQDVPEAVLAVIEQTPQTTPELIDLLAGDWDAPDCRERASAFVLRYVEHWRRNSAVFRARDLAADEGDERFIRSRYVAVQVLIEMIYQRTAAMRAAGLLPPDLHPASAAGGIMAMVERIAATPTVGGMVTSESIARSAAYFLTVLMHGLPGARAGALSHVHPIYPAARAAGDRPPEE